jgi:mRNA interferase RelE/StbE
VAKYRLLRPRRPKETETVASKSDRRRIEKIGGSAEDPRPQGSEKLAGYDDRYRVRQGDYRIVDDNATTVIVYKVGHRKDVYR